MSLVLDYIATPTFARIHRDKNRYIFVMGPVGSGKTSGCIWHIWLNGAKQIPQHDGVRRSRYAIVRATYGALEGSLLQSWKSWFKDRLVLTMSKPFKGVLKMDLPDGTSMEMELWFIAAEDERAVEHFRSREFTGIHCAEASELPAYLMTVLPTRINRYPALKDTDGIGPVDPFLLFDYNAISTDHWLYKITEVNKPAGCSFYRQPPAVLKVGDGYIVNPEAENLQNLSPSYYPDTIVALLSQCPEAVEINLMNNYGEYTNGRVVYPQYSDIEHNSEEIKPKLGVELIIGMDQGLTPAAVFTQQGADGTVYVYEEITTEDCDLQTFIKDLLLPRLQTTYRSWANNYVVVVDPATCQRSMNDSRAGTDILDDLGVVWRPAKTNNPMARRSAVIQPLLRKNNSSYSNHKYGFVLVGSKCSVLRKGFISGYKYSEIKTATGSFNKQFKETPVKNEYSHVHDALQYACLEYYTPMKNRKKSRVYGTRHRYMAASPIGGY